MNTINFISIFKNIVGVLYTQVHAGVSQANILYSEQACIIIIYNYYVFNLIRFSIIIIVRYSCSTFKIIIAITDMFFPTRS